MKINANTDELKISIPITHATNEKLFEPVIENVNIIESKDIKVLNDITYSILVPEKSKKNEDDILILKFDEFNKNEFDQTEYTINFTRKTLVDLLMVGGGGSGGIVSTSERVLSSERLYPSYYARQNYFNINKT